MGRQKIEELELLNDNLVKEVEELKKSVEERNEEIKKMREVITEHFNNFVILNMPFGQKGDVKIIQIMVLRETYENEIIPYNKMYDALKEAEKNMKPISEMPTELKVE